MRPLVGRQHLRFNPEPVGVVVICAIVVAVVCVIFLLRNLAGVLVPLVFAVFLAFLTEPILSVIVLAPDNVMSFCRRRCRRRGGELQGEKHDAEACTPLPRGCADGGGCCPGAAAPAVAPEAGSGERGAGPEGGDGRSLEPPQRSACWWVQKSARRTWDILSILICVALLCGFLAGIGLVTYSALQSFDWSNYGKGKKLQDIQELLDKVGISLSNVTAGEVFSDYKGEVVSTALVVLNVFECILLTILLFIFCLVAILPGIHQRAASSRVKALMQRYLVCKTIASLIVALACTLALWAMKVPLVAIFGLVTFVLNYIPNIGAFFAILAPLPLVLLDSDKTIIDAILVVVVPFGIHNSLGCVVESSVMAEGLDMHPLTIVVALTFWGSVWGIAGAVLSVPVTCCLKLFLGEVDHSVARNLHDMFQHPFGRRRSSKRGTAASALSGSSSSSALTTSTAMTAPSVSRAITTGHLPNVSPQNSASELEGGRSGVGVGVREAEKKEEEEWRAGATVVV